MVGFLAGKHRRRLTAAAAIPTLIFYAVLTGGSPSVVRACVMLSFLTAAPLFRRESDPPTALMAALFLILLDNPFAAKSVSLQLSFGAVVGLRIADFTIGLTSVLGFITLLGMIVRNVILMYQHAEDKRKVCHWSGKLAAYDAGKRRMVPIFLTTATTAVGVVPMMLGGSTFWAPVGVTIFAGGIGSLILVVTILPVLYSKIYK